MLNIIFEGIKDYWLKVEVENKDSIFYKEKITEDEFFNLCRKSGGTTHKILRAIKLSILEKGKCYYSQRDFAEYFKVSQSTVKQSIKLIEKVLQTKFLPIPTSVINNNLSKQSSFRQILIPPSLFSQLKLSVEEGKLSVEEGKLSVDSIEAECRNLDKLLKLGIKKTRTYIPIYNTLYNIFYSYSCTSYKNEEKNYIAMKTKSFHKRPKLFIFKNKEQCMKYKLKMIDKKEKKIVTYDSFGLHPKQFMNHVEVHKVLEKWIEICIDKGFSPNREITKLFLQTWNNYGNPRFIKHKLNTKSLIFKLISLALTYRMHSENLNLEDMEKAIKKFDLLSSKQGRLLYIKKLDCLSHFLWNSKSYGQKDYFQLCILDEDVVLTEYYNKTVPPKRAFERVRKMFGKVFFNGRPKLGKSIFNKNYKRFVDFTNEMVNNHRTKEMLSFVDNYENNLIEGFTEYVESYFNYIYKKIENSNSLFVWTPKFILGQHEEFVLWLSKQPGWEDFMKDKKIETKSKKFKLTLDK